MQTLQATDATYLAGTGFPDTLQPTDVTSHDNGVTGAGSTLGQEGPGTTLPPNYSAGFFSSVILNNDPLYPTVCHIHVCETFPLRKVVSNERCP